LDSAAQERQFLVAGQKNALPNPAAIIKAGGIPSGEIPSIGVVVARSSNPDFLSLIRRDPSVALASLDLGLKVPEAEPAFEDSAAGGALEEAPSTVAEPPSGVTSDDPLSKLQWDHLVMGVKNAHDRGITGKGVTVAVVDTGIDKTHPDLVGAVIPAGYSLLPLPQKSCTQDSDCPLLPDPKMQLSTSRCDTEQHQCVLSDGSTGYRTPFPDGVGNPDPAKAVDEGHGTAVSGIIAATCNNKIGICGIAPDARLLSVRISDGEHNFPVSRILQAYDWASSEGVSRYGVRIINASHLATCHSDDPDCRENVVHLYGIANRMLSLVYQRGVVLFAAAGNGVNGVGVNVTADDSFKLWPARDGAHAIAVGATGPCGAALDGDPLNDLASDPSFYDRLAVYSNFGFDPNQSRYLVMPGGQRLNGCSYPKPRCQVVTALGTLNRPCQAFDQVWSTTFRDSGQAPALGYINFSGTSASTPEASGLAALLLSRFPDLTAGQLTEAMLGTGDMGIDLTVDIGAPGYDPLFGYGRGSAAAIP
jgi:subtilisin family serine protease